MKILFAIIGSLLLVAVAAFCVFGFLATYSPVHGVQDRLLGGRSRLSGRHRLLDRERSSEVMLCRNDPQPL